MGGTPAAIPNPVDGLDDTGVIAGVIAGVVTAGVAAADDDNLEEPSAPLGDIDARWLAILSYLFQRK
jgi:hypothetical protein